MFNEFNQEYMKYAQSHQTQYKKGDIVTWSSHSPKGRSTKTGVIVAVIEPGEDVSVSFKDFHLYHLSPAYGTPRAIRSYLVSVEQPSKRHRKNKLYFPFPSMLSLIKN